MTVAATLTEVDAPAGRVAAGEASADAAKGADEGQAEDLEPGRAGTLRAGRRRVAVSLRPSVSAMPPGTTLTVELTARRREATLDIVVSAEAEGVIVRTTLGGKPLPERRFMAPRRSEVDLLVETVESVGPDPVAVAALLTAAELVGEP
jgi:hypothetical protein